MRQHDRTRGSVTTVAILMSSFVVCVLLATGGKVALNGASAIATSAQQLAQQAIPTTTTLAMARDAVVSAERDLRQEYINGTPSAVATAPDIQTLDDALTTLQQANPALPIAMRQELAALDLARQPWRTTLYAMELALAQHRPQAVVIALATTWAAQSQQIDLCLQRLMDLAQQRVATIEAAMFANALQLLWLLGAFVLLALIVGAIIGSQMASLLTLALSNRAETLSASTSKPPADATAPGVITGGVVLVRQPSELLLAGSALEHDLQRLTAAIVAVQADAAPVPPEEIALLPEIAPVAA